MNFLDNTMGQYPFADDQEPERQRQEMDTSQANDAFLQQSQAQQQPQQLQAPQAPTPPPPPSALMESAAQPFNINDERRLGEVNEAESIVRRQLANDEIYPHEAEELMRQIMPQKKALLEKQQKTRDQQQAQALKQQQEMMLHQSAMTRSVQQSDSEHWAEGVQRGIGTILDLTSGRTLGYLFQNGKGGIEQLRVEPDRATGVEPSQAGMGASSLFTVGGALGAQTLAGAPLPAGSEALPAEQGGPQQGQPVSLEQFGARMRGEESGAPLPQIRNALGQNIDQRLIDSGEIPDPRKSAVKEGEIGLSQEAIQQIYKKADASIPRLSGDASPQAQLHRQTLVNDLVAKQVDNYHLSERAKETYRHRELQHTADYKAKEQEARNKEAFVKVEAEIARQARSEDNRLKEEARKELAGTGKHLGADRMHNMLIHHLDAASKKAENYQLTGDPKTQPEWMKTEEGIHGQGVNNYRKAMRALGYDQTGNKIEGGGGGPPPPADQGKAFTQDIGGKTGQGGPPPAVEVPPTVRDKPSSIEAGRARQILPFVANALRDAKAVKVGEGVQDALQTMHDTLQKAHDEDRNLTVQERKTYEDNHKHLSEVLTKHKAGSAEWAQLEGPGGTRPELPPTHQEKAAADEQKRADESAKRQKELAFQESLAREVRDAPRKAMEARAKFGTIQAADAAILDDAEILNRKLAHVPGSAEILQAIAKARKYQAKGLRQLTQAEKDDYDATMKFVKRK